MEPTLSQVIDVVRQSSGHHRKSIDGTTRIEADLDICGIDGADLLEDCEKVFGVKLSNEEDGYRKTFELAENEYLFTGEGIDLFGLRRFLDWMRGIPTPVIRDLTIDELHHVLINAVREQQNY